ncbi:MAG: non-canonical purine NTP diphosphatase [Flavobacteriaceae bacterium]|nr:non-canonical purine NTP diphosphatase [Flavobacteriaceae bacterium]
MKIVFATHNKNKLKEVQSMLSDSITLLSLDTIECFDEIPETAETLEGNAILKANYITEKYGYDCFADDTGLEVEALDGAPGVYSARYAGQENDANANVQKLLRAMHGYTDRNAQFRTVIALNLKGKLYLFEGVCKGEIIKNPQGENGFGYDSIFKPEGFDRSFAEMSLTEKNKISHRALAIDKLVRFLSKTS